MAQWGNDFEGQRTLTTGTSVNYRAVAHFGDDPSGPKPDLVKVVDADVELTPAEFKELEAALLSELTSN